MKRYALFAFTFYEGSGGWNDFIDSFDSIDEAKAHPEWIAAQQLTGRFYNHGAHIIDLNTGETVGEP